MPPPPETEALAVAAAAGDAQALEELLRLIQPDVLRRCARFLPNRQDAEEAAQDALLQVARRIGTFEGRSRFSTWLYTVVGNSARQTYRVMCTDCGSCARKPGMAARMACTTLTVLASGWRCTASVIAGSRVDLLEALEQLDKTRPLLVAPFVLRDILDLEYDEIANRLDVPLGTVKSRLVEARRQIRQLLIERTP